jgi:hypothetical protein
VIATLDWTGMPTPIQILCVLPEARRRSLRPEMAFHFTSYATMLHALPAAAELEVHDGIEHAFAEQVNGNMAFAIQPERLPCELAIDMAAMIECLCSSMLDWTSRARAEIGAAPPPRPRAQPGRLQLRRGAAAV